MGKPNFLIVGAAKSGTTSLCNYLNMHDRVFIPEHKEPKFFFSQHYPEKLQGPDKEEALDLMVRSFEEYCNLFPEEGQYLALGEGSVDNLYFYRQSIPLIKEYLGDVRIIILLRNPVKRAYSAYKHLVRQGLESRSFEQALKLEEDRVRDNYMPLWFLKRAGLYYEQVKAYMHAFSNVEVRIFETFVKNTNEEMKLLFQFLGVDPVQVEEGKVYNKSEMPRSKLIYQTIAKNRNYLREVVRSVAGKKYDLLKEKYYSTFFMKDRMNRKTLQYLNDYFADDISRLEDLLKVDLSQWK